MSEDFVRRRVRIPNPQGLHARPSSMLVRAAMEHHEAELEIENLSNGVVADAKHLLEVLTLGAAQGVELEIRGRGEGAEAAVAQLADIVEGGFGEG